MKKLTLIEFKKLKDKELTVEWYNGANEVYDNFESFCWHRWQESDCVKVYSDIKELA